MSAENLYTEISEIVDSTGEMHVVAYMYYFEHYRRLYGQRVGETEIQFFYKM